MDRAFFGLIYDGAGLSEYFEDGAVGLQRAELQARDIRAAEDCARHKEIGGGAPVSFDAEVSRVVSLAAFHLEIYVAVGSDAVHLYAEAVQHIQRHKQIRHAAGVFHVYYGILVQQREGGHQAGYDLGAVPA